MDSDNFIKMEKEHALIAQVALVIDRLLLWMFFSAMTVASLVILTQRQSLDPPKEEEEADQVKDFPETDSQIIKGPGEGHHVGTYFFRAEINCKKAKENYKVISAASPIEC